jgi:Family of unknown function (DUF6504)
MGFVSEAITAGEGFVDTAALSAGEPPLPRRFVWHGEHLEIASLVRTWRSTNTDRGDTYLARHWYEVALTDERTATIYFDRKAKRGGARWWLYAIEEARA